VANITQGKHIEHWPACLRLRSLACMIYMTTLMWV